MGCHCKCETSMSKDMMKLSNKAWASLMIEKMKEEFEKTQGDKMKKAAIAVAKASSEYHDNLYSGEEWKGWDELEKELNGIFKA